MNPALHACTCIYSQRFSFRFSFFSSLPLKPPVFVEADAMHNEIILNIYFSDVVLEDVESAVSLTLEEEPDHVVKLKAQGERARV